MEKDNYRQIKEPINSDLYSVQNKEYKWSVCAEQNNSKKNKIFFKN